MFKRLFVLSVTLSALSILTACASSQSGTATGPAGPPGPTGPAGLIYSGPFKPATSYTTTDWVTLNGSSYVAIANSDGVAPLGDPDSSKDWSVLAQAGASGLMGPQGIQGPVGPQGVAGPQGGPGQGAFLQARHFGVQGDSLSSQYNNVWQNTFIQRTGMVLTLQDARSSRRFADALECWGNPAIGSAPGNFDPALSHCDGNLSIIAGSSFAESLTNTDLLLIQLGANDAIANTPLGAIGDPITANTYFGNMRWVVEAYLNAKPTMRVVLVTLQYMGIVSPAVSKEYADATVAYANSMGLPVINMNQVGGVNAVTAPTLLLPDQVHPTTFAFQNFYAPVIAQRVMQVF